MTTATTTTTPMSERGDEILDAARDLFGQRGSTWDQFRRYSLEHLRWCQREGFEPPVDAVTRGRYREFLDARGILTSEQSWKVRATVLNKLPAAIAEVERRDRVSAAQRRTRLIDALPVSSKLRRAINERCEGKPPPYRASLRADLSVVLEWCAEHSIDPESLGPLELRTFRQWFAESRRRSRGPENAARWLHRRLYEPVSWWR